MGKITLFLLFSFIFSCKERSSNLSNTNFANCRAGTCLHKIKTKREFESLASKIQSSLSTNQIVKVVYRRSTRTKSGTVYFMDTKKFPYHVDFVNQGLGVRVGVGTFNSQNYTGTGEKREFNLASLIYYKATEPGTKDRMLVEMWSGDTIDADHFKELYKQIDDVFDWDIDLIYHPLSTIHEKLIKSLKAAGIPTITTQQLFKGRKYFALNKGEGVGFLRMVKDNPTGCLDHTSIPVYDKVPNEIGLHSGVITTAFQTPLSHVNVKSINRGTINMVLLEGETRLRKNKDDAVRVTVRGDKHTIEKINAMAAKREIDKFWNRKRPKKANVPISIPDPQFVRNFGQFSQLFRSLTPGTNKFRQAHKKFVQTFGAKATNLAVINRMISDFHRRPDKDEIDVKVPDGYAISFNYFDRFMNFKQTGLDPTNPTMAVSPNDLIARLLDPRQSDLLDANKFHSVCEKQKLLSTIRGIIMRAKVPPKMIEAMRQIIIVNPNSPVHISKVPRIRLRSSTNSEDLEGFNGAGLYNSKGVNLYKRNDDGSFDPTKPKSWPKIAKKLAEKIPEVYSGVWNDRAFAEREWFRMNGPNHLKVKVGIAVHRSFPKHNIVPNGTGGMKKSPGEIANGVAISKDIYKEDGYLSVYLNSQHYDLAVTNPPEDKDLQIINEDPRKPYLTEEALVIAFASDPRVDQRLDSWKYWSYGISSRSSIKGGAPVLIDDPDERRKKEKMEIRRLAKVIDYLDTGFANLFRKPKDRFALDTEWKIFGPERTIWVKQARPFDSGNAGNSLRGIGRFRGPQTYVGIGPRYIRPKKPAETMRNMK